jgi:DNA repair protein RadD
LSFSFENLLARADTPTLSGLMPPGAAKLLGAIDQQLAYPKNMGKVLLALTPPPVLLYDQTSRNVLFDLLPPESAKLLASLLGVSPTTDAYEFLKATKFSTAKQKEQLLKFFGVGLPAVEEVEPTPNETIVEPSYALFPHQINALLRVRQKLNADPYRVLLHMPTGSGKTRTAMNLIADHLRERRSGVVVWLAHSEELCQQAASEFEAAWRVLGNRKLRLARYWGSHSSDLADFKDGVVIAGLSKAFARLKADSKDFIALAGRDPLVVLDEAHQAIAPTYQQLLELLVRPTTGARLLGLSATPGRSWSDVEQDEKLSNFFARAKVTLQVDGYDNPISFLIAEGFLASPVFRRIRADANIELTYREQCLVRDTFDLPASVLERLGRDEGRNLLVIHEIERLLQRHKRVIVFASSVEQSGLLAAVLSARGHCASTVSSLSGVTERKRAIEDYLRDDELPRVLCNFGVLTTGFDAPRTSAALVARPTLSLVLYSQMIGRAMRGPKAGGNSQAEIVTVVDPSIKGFDSVESAFSNWEDVWKDN